MLHLKILFSLVAFLALISCDDDESSLPPVSTSGKNTLGFIVDGQIWKPCCFKEGGLFGFDKPDRGGTLSKRSYDAWIYASNKNIVNDSLKNDNIISNDESNFEIILNFDSNFVYKNVSIKYSNLYHYRRKIDASEFGEMFEVLMLDTTNGIFSGRFDIDLFQVTEDGLDSSKRLYLSEGRFDMMLELRGGFGR